VIELNLKTQIREEMVRLLLPCGDFAQDTETLKGLYSDFEVNSRGVETLKVSFANQHIAMPGYFAR